jgi:CNT family concentrative nucleoside transporter
MVAHPMNTVTDILRGLLGIGILLLIGFGLSRNRKRIDWPLVLKSLGLQFIIALLVLKVGFIKRGFNGIAFFFQKLLDFSGEGAAFIFGPLVTDTQTFGYIFACQVLPTIVFFSGLTSVLYYLNVLQYIVYGFAWVMKRTMRISGVESLAAAANIFVGQTEAPLVVKPYVSKMTRSEMMCLMTGGMATIAGGVLVAYIGMLGGDDPVARQAFATHLLVASIMSAPAAVLAAKLLVPETEEYSEELLFPRHDMGCNLLDAVTTGTTQGLKLALNVGAMLVVFTGMIALINFALQAGIGEWTGLNAIVAKATAGQYEGFTLQFVLGMLFAPMAWILGVPHGDLLAVGQLLGEKTVLNEFYAYATFGNLKSTGVITHPKSIMITTYALCGFANFASIGIQIGGIGVIAPNKRVTLSQLGIYSLIGGTIACFLTACIAGMLV